MTARYKILWDAGRNQYVVLDMTTWKRVNAFDHAWQAEHWVCALGADALIELDEVLDPEAAS